ncbi:fumarylacetoacetate hydrolase family protein [Streptomyces sp. NPDC002790]|uniref:fumarylacetoacetate hydrolase family protein n=1 Tax=Streptomyces sp. NPDC002790 TaxID=3154431 RepID=UPI00331706CE
MRYVRYYDDNDTIRVGELNGDHVTPLTDITTIDATTDTDRLAAADRDTGARFPAGARRLAPVADPRRVFCVGLNYHAHVEETRRELPTYPVLFTKFASALIGAHDDIPLPPESEQVDYEGELAVIIGRPGRRITPEDAPRHILGYSVANDITMRDFQYKTHQWLQGKAWDNSTPLGPCLVTPDEIDLDSQRITTTLNGEVLQSSTLDRLIFSIPQLISTVSGFTALQPGDVILTGTPGGVGHRRDPQLFLHSGDEITVEVTGIGKTHNRVVDEKL